MFKINWGTGIFIVIILFLGTVVWRIYLAGLNPVELVSEDYYPKGIEYSQQIQREKNTLNANYKPEVFIKNDTVGFQFPDELKGNTIEGVFHFYRPSDNKLDKFVPIKLDTAMVQFFSKNELSKGKYILKVYWTTQKVEYYFEQEIII